MRGFTWFRRGAHATLRASADDRELDDELAFHIGSRADHLVSRGMSREAAARQARLEFGSAGRIADECRDARRFTLVEDMVRDLRHGRRSLGRHPALIAISVASLALGIGVNTLLFSAISAVFLARPTAAAPEQLVWVEPAGSFQLAYLNARDLAHTGGFASLSAYRQMSLSATIDGTTVSAVGFVVTPSFFDTLGVVPAIGRGFDPGPPSETIHEIVISHRFWRGRLGGADAPLGRVMIVNGAPYTVVGVLAEDYAPLIRFVDPDIYVPASGTVLPRFDVRDDTNALEVFARLHRDHGLERARAALAAFDRDRERPAGMARELAIRPGRIEPLGPIRMSEAPLAARALPPFFALLCGLVLLIAAANVAGLLLARAAGQRHELALLSALGAPRWRVIQRMFMESLLLSAAGAAGGLLLTWLVMPLLQQIAIPLLGVLHFRMRFDWTMGVYAVLLTLATGLACGLMPALAATRGAPAPLLLHPGVHGGAGRLRLRQCLVIAEAAATVVLLVAALLFTRTLLRLSSVDTGLDLDKGLVSIVELKPGDARSDRILGAARQLLEQLDAVPGVEGSAIAEYIPLSMSFSSARFSLEGETTRGARTTVNSVSPRYFAVMGIPLLGGRHFTERDTAGTAPVVIVNREFAAGHFPGGNAIGRRIRAGTDPLSEIVGIVENNSIHNAGETPWPQVFYAWTQRPVSSQEHPLNVIVRASRPPESMVRTIHAITSRFEIDSPTKTMTLQEATSFEFVVRRAGARLLSGLGLLGWLLAAVGLHGIVSYVVASRTTELGVRMALGATNSMVRRDVLWRGLRLTLYGLAIGLFFSLAGARLLRSALAGLSPADPITFVASAALLIAMGLAASYWPARRATRVNPMAALRDQ